MNEIKILEENYKNTEEEIYLKSLYAMIISKIENKTNMLIQKHNILIQNSDYFLEKLKDENYKKKIENNILKHLSNKNFKVEKMKEYDELFKLYLIIKERRNINIHSQMNRMFSEKNLEKKLKETIFCNQGNLMLPQNVAEINGIFNELVGEKLFDEVTTESNSLVEIGNLYISEDLSHVIDIEKIFNDLYTRRQDSVHNDLVKNIDTEKLEKQLYGVSIVFSKLSSFEKKINLLEVRYSQVRRTRRSRSFQKKIVNPKMFRNRKIHKRSPLCQTTT